MSKSNGELNSQGNTSITRSVSVFDLEKVLQDYLQQSVVEGVEDHLVEYSQALITVTKALTRVAKRKASAQADASEWNRKYELERAGNLQQEDKEKTREIEEKSSCSTLVDLKHILSIFLNCFHDRTMTTELLSRDGHLDSNGKGTENSLDQPLLQHLPHEQSEMYSGKDKIFAQSRLQNGASASGSKVVPDKMERKASFRLAWWCSGRDQHKHEIVSFEKGNITTVVRSSKQISLLWEAEPRNVFILTKPNSITVRSLCAEMVRWLKDEKKINIFVEPHVRTELLAESPYFNFVQTWEDDTEISSLHKKIDLIVTLGGDGTVLWAASMFQGPIPPVVPFALGSLGFMTSFDSERYREHLDSILKGPVSLTLRHRLQCQVIRDGAKDGEPIIVLNEVTIDRGMSAYLTNLECFCDSSLLTCVQGDGLIISTTSGSTAYSLAAGGSMVHPQVPGILFTPICPHSLSFRPLILPEYVTLRVQVPENSRGGASASFDGKNRKDLAAGDALEVSIGPWPVSTACPDSSTTDFLRSIRDGLLWNMRKQQLSDGPRETF